MSPLKESLGIQSYCFRHFKTNEEVAEKLAACGVRAVELCGVHVDFARPDSYEAALRPYREKGIAVVSVGVNLLGADAARARPTFEFARRAGARVVSANFSPDEGPEAWKTAERLAEEYDLRIGIHNHGGRHWLGSRQMLAHVFARTGCRIGLTLDTAWALDAGENLEEMVEQFAGRIYGLHLKDFVFDRARRRTDVAVGTGNLDLPRLLPKLEALPSLGFAVLEYEADAENPVPALRACVDAVRNTLG